MAGIVLEHALLEGDDGGNDANARARGGQGAPPNPAQRAAVVAAYAAAELHLLSEAADLRSASGGVDGNDGSKPSLSGNRYRATWTFLEDRSSDDAAHRPPVRGCVGRGVVPRRRGA